MGNTTDWLTQAAFARACSVSRMAISKAARSGRVVVDPVTGLIDPARAENAAFFELHAAPASQPAPKSSPGKPSGRTRSATSTEKPLTLQKLEAEVTLRREQGRMVGLKRRVHSRELLERRVVQQLLDRFGSELKIHLVDLPRRIGAQVLALAQSTADPAEIEDLLEREIADALDRSLRAATTEEPAGE